MHCPLCLSEKNEFYHQDKIRSYQHCLVCDLVFVHSQYFLSANREKARYDLHDNNPGNEGYKQFLLQIVKPMIGLLNPDDTGLDFGCGPQPALATLFQQYNYIVDLYDPFFANKPEVLTRKYNFITATEVVEHLHYPAQVFQQLVEMLQPNGILGIMTKAQPLRNAFANWWYKNDSTHVCFYSEATCSWIAEKWNLTIVYRRGDVVVFRKSS